MSVKPKLWWKEHESGTHIGLRAIIARCDTYLLPFFASLPPCASQIAFHFIQRIMPCSTFDSKFVESFLHRHCIADAQYGHTQYTNMTLMVRNSTPMYSINVWIAFKWTSMLSLLLFGAMWTWPLKKLSHICVKKVRRSRCCVRCNKSTFRTKNKMMKKWSRYALILTICKSGLVNW